MFVREKLLAGAAVLTAFAALMAPAHAATRSAAPQCHNGPFALGEAAIGQLRVCSFPASRHHRGTNTDRGGHK